MSDIGRMMKAARKKLNCGRVVVATDEYGIAFMAWAHQTQEQARDSARKRLIAEGESVSLQRLSAIMDEEGERRIGFARGKTPEDAIAALVATTPKTGREEG